MEGFRALLADVERDQRLDDADRFASRLEVLDRIDAYLAHVDSADAQLLGRAQAVCARLEARNAALYQVMRQDIRSGRGAGRLMQYVEDCRRPSAVVGRVRDPLAYDLLDELVSGVLQFDEPQGTTVELTPDLVFYQPTPSRHIFEMIRRSGLGEGDVLVDLGAGLGHVSLLAAICTRAHSIGIELEPAYVACARQAAASLHLANACFLESDARTADLSSGTVFYLYTPFKGAVLREVLDRLRQEAAMRAIRVCTFGPCTFAVAQEAWLAGPEVLTQGDVAVFRSGES